MPHQIKIEAVRLKIVELQKKIEAVRLPNRTASITQSNGFNLETDAVRLKTTVASMKHTSILITLLCLLAAKSQGQAYEFSHLNNDDGLVNNQVEHIFKDSRGFMWFATNLGLNRYDGTNFKVYTQESRSSSSNRFTSIQEDQNGNLWLFSTQYCVYDWKQERFITNTDSLLALWGLPPTPRQIEIDEQKNLYLYYPTLGIYKYDVKRKTKTCYPQTGEAHTLDRSYITTFKSDHNQLWILHQNGILERLNTALGSVDLRNEFFKESTKSSTIMKSLFVDADGDLWIYPGVADKGLAYLRPKENSWTRLDVDTQPALSSSFVRRIAQDNSGMLWIGTDHGGINLLNKQQKSLTVLKNSLYNQHTIGQNSIISILCEKEGTVWIGSYKNGISYYNPTQFKFNKSPLFELFNRNEEPLDCNSLYKDRANNLWIGTNGNGLIKYNHQTKAVNIFTHDAHKQSLSSNIVTSLFEDHAQTLWIGTFLGGLNAYDGKRFTNYQMSEYTTNALSNKSVYGVAEDKEHNLWIGTLGGGVDKLDPTRTTFTNYNVTNSKLLSNFILSLFSDQAQQIYLSSNQGVNVIKQGVITPYFNQPLTSDSLNYPISNNLLTDSKGLLWMATNNGICLHNPTTQTTQEITTNDGLPSNEVVSLMEDNEGNIWAGTRNGLAYINRSTTQPNNFTIATFTEKDGLPSSVCNQNAVFKDTQGLIYIGTTKGYTCFNPKDIAFNTAMPTPKFTELLIDNQVIKPNTRYNGRVILSETIHQLKEITLHHGETNITIRFAALNYIHPQKCRYRYMLKGLDNQFTTTTNGIGAASYSNLPAGTYRLIVYASNEDARWTDKPIELTIVVTPPFYRSWWAFLIYFLMLMTLLKLFVRYKLNKQKERFEQDKKVIEATKIHEVDELKLKFFTNISHEFKTPLTLILVPLEKLLQAPASEEQKEILTIINRNALNLLTMVNEILDFRKFDLNKMNLIVSQGDIVAFTREVCHSFSSLSIERSIKLTFTSYLQELLMDFDKEKMNKIISNLLSNAFKYTEEGQITLSIAISETLQANHESTKQLCLTVQDTGSGIEKQYLDRIFDRFYRIESAEKSNIPGTGVGLHLVQEYVKLHKGEIAVESVLGKGTTFTLLFPIANSVLKEQPIQESTPLQEIETAEVNRSTDNQHPQLAQRTNLPLLLIVDDNEDFCNFITTLFNQDYRTVTANDGEEGWLIVLDQIPDIILCDVMMPKMDGYQFCRNLKEDIRTSHTPIILLTAKSSEEHKYAGIEAGADDYISKPFNIELLKLKISKIIERQKRMQQNFKKKIDISISEIEITTMDEKFVKKAIAFVEQEIGNSDFLVEDLCKLMGMSRVYFYKKTVALTDKTPSEFIRFIRLKRAAELLKKSQLFVNEIAFQVGFNDPKYFRKYFKEEFGVTPNEYKKEGSKENIE